MRDPNKSLDRIRDALGERGIHVSKSALSRYERGERAPDCLVLKGLATLYRVRFEALADFLLIDASGRAFDPGSAASDLIRHGADIEGASMTGGSPYAHESDAVAGLVEAVRAENAELRRAVSRHAEAILELLGDDARRENPDLEPEKPTTRRRDRGAH
jgi:transcriptional regulator with XRE-family HTH domain